MDGQEVVGRLNAPDASLRRLADGPPFRGPALGFLHAFLMPSLSLVALPWTVLRLAARAHAFLRAPSNTR